MLLLSTMVDLVSETKGFQKVHLGTSLTLLKKQCANVGKNSWTSMVRLDQVL